MFMGTKKLHKLFYNESNSAVGINICEITNMEKSWRSKRTSKVLMGVRQVLEQSKRVAYLLATDVHPELHAL